MIKQLSYKSFSSYVHENISNQNINNLMTFYMLKASTGNSYKLFFFFFLRTQNLRSFYPSLNFIIFFLLLLLAVTAEPDTLVN